MIMRDHGRAEVVCITLEIKRTQPENKEDQWTVSLAQIWDGVGNHSYSYQRVSTAGHWLSEGCSNGHPHSPLEFILSQNWNILGFLDGHQGRLTILKWPFVFHTFWMECKTEICSSQSMFRLKKTIWDLANVGLYWLRHFC